MRLFFGSLTVFVLCMVIFYLFFRSFFASVALPLPSHFSFATIWKEREKNTAHEKHTYPTLFGNQFNPNHVHSCYIVYCTLYFVSKLALYIFVYVFNILLAMYRWMDGYKFSAQQGRQPVSVQNPKWKVP